MVFRGGPNREPAGAPEARDRRSRRFRGDAAFYAIAGDRGTTLYRVNRIAARIKNVVQFGARRQGALLPA
jgi:hypothetical protein